MRLSTYSLAGLLAAAATTSAKLITVEVGNPTAPVASDKLKFLPSVVKADPGDTVRFHFNGNHTVTRQDDFNLCAPSATKSAGAFDSGVRVKDATFDVPPASLVPGAVVNFYCKIANGAHCRAPNFMQGAIVVSSLKAGAANASVPAGGAAAGSKGAAAAGKKGGAAGGAAAAVTITITVGKDGQNQFSPSNIEASPGDTVTFRWTGGAKMHNIVPSDVPQTCTRSTKADTDPTMKALASGPPQSSGQHVFKVPKTAAVGSVLSFYCAVGTHCSADKMFGSIRIVPPGTAKNVAPAAGAAAAAAPNSGGAVGADPPPGTIKSGGGANLAASSMAVLFPVVAAVLRNV